MLFWLERARHSHILRVYTLQVYRHPTSIQTPNKYTISRIQVQTHKCKSRHPNTSPDTQNTIPDTNNTSPCTKIQVQTPKIQVQTSQHILGCIKSQKSSQINLQGGSVSHGGKWLPLIPWDPAHSYIYIYIYYIYIYIYTKIDGNRLKSTRYMLRKPVCVFFSEVAEVPQATTTQTHRAWGPLKSTKSQQNQQDTCSTNPGVCVCLFLRSPKRRRQLRHRHTGLGDCESGENHKCIRIYIYIYI